MFYIQLTPLTLMFFKLKTLITYFYLKMWNFLFYPIQSIDLQTYSYEIAIFVVFLFNMNKYLESDFKILYACCLGWQPLSNNVNQRGNPKKTFSKSLNLDLLHESSSFPSTKQTRTNYQLIKIRNHLDSIFLYNSTSNPPNC